jgi:hypothetical protein
MAADAVLSSMAGARAPLLPMAPPPAVFPSASAPSLLHFFVPLLFPCAQGALWPAPHDPLLPAMAPKNPPTEPPLPASAPVPLLLLPRTTAARPTFPRCAAPRRNAAVPASPGFLAATAARMPSARHNVKGDVLLQHVVTLAGCSLFLAQPRSRRRRPSVRHSAPLAAITFFLCAR